MKVLVINLDKGIFAPNSKSLERLREYAAFCEKLSVIVLTRWEFGPIIEGNLSVFATGSCCRLQYTLDALRLAKKIISDGADLVMTQDPFDTGHIGWLIKKRFRIPWQCQVHTDFLSPYFWRESLANKIRVLAAGFLLRRADGVRVVSERIKSALLAAGYLFKVITVLPIIVDAGKIEAAPIGVDLRKKYSQFEFLILTAGRLSREKNIGLMIEAMAEVVKKYPKTGLVIVGEGAEYENLKSKTKNLSPFGRPPAGRKLETNIVFEPWIDDVVSYLKSADLFLLVSNYEGWGMAAIEAAAAGCPVLMTDVGCAGEVIVNDVSGIVAPVNDKSALVGGIIRLIEDGALREKIRRNALLAVQKLPTKKNYLARYRQSWEAIVDGGKSEYFF